MVTFLCEPRLFKVCNLYVALVCGGCTLNSVVKFTVLKLVRTTICSDCCALLEDCLGSAASARCADVGIFGQCTLSAIDVGDTDVVISVGSISIVNLIEITTCIILTTIDMN